MPALVKGVGASRPNDMRGPLARTLEAEGLTVARKSLGDPLGAGGSGPSCEACRLAEVARPYQKEDCIALAERRAHAPPIVAFRLWGCRGLPGSPLHRRPSFF